MKGGFLNRQGEGSRPASSSTIPIGLGPTATPSSRPQRTDTHAAGADPQDDRLPWTGPAFEEMPEEYKGMLIGAAKDLATHHNVDPNLFTDRLTSWAQGGPGPSMSNLAAVEPRVPNSGLPVKDLMCALIALDRMDAREVKRKVAEVLQPDWFLLVVRVQADAGQLQCVVASLEGKAKKTAQDDAREMSKALKELHYNLLQSICLEMDGKPTLLGSLDPPKFIVAHLSFYVPQLLRDMDMVSTLISAAKMQVAYSIVDRNSAGLLMSIISYVFDPYQKTCEGHMGVDGEKMVLYPKNLVITAANEHFIALAFSLWKDYGTPSGRAPAARSGLFLESLASSSEVLIPTQIELCRSIITPQASKAIRECLSTKNFDVLIHVFDVIKRALGYPVRKRGESYVKNASLYSKWPHVMPEFVKEEWTHSWVSTMEFLKDEIAKGSTALPRKRDEPFSRGQQAFKLSLEVLHIFNAATNNHTGAFGFEDRSQNRTPFDSTPWPPTLIKAHANLTFQVLSEVPSLFLDVMPCIRPYAHSPLALQIGEDLLLGVGICIAFREFVPEDLMKKEFVDALQVFLCACQHSQRRPHALHEPLGIQLTFPLPDFTGHLHSHEPPSPLFRAAQFIMPWAEALSLGKSMDFEGVQEDRWQNWDRHVNMRAPPDLVEMFNDKVQDCWLWQEPTFNVPELGASTHNTNKETVMKGIAQLIGFLAFVCPSADNWVNLLFLRIVESREKSCKWLRSHPAIKPLIQAVKGMVPVVVDACSMSSWKTPSYISSSVQQPGSKPQASSRPTSAAANGGAAKAAAPPPPPSKPPSAANGGAAKAAAQTAPSASSRPPSSAADGAAKAPPPPPPSKPPSEAADGAAKAAPSASTPPVSAADGGAAKAAAPTTPGPPPVHVPPKQPGTSSSKGQLRRCLGCHKEGYGFKKCSVCTGRFCSVECQRAAWPEHKKVCKPPAQSLDELPPGVKACRCSRPGGPGGYYN